MRMTDDAEMSPAERALARAYALLQPDDPATSEPEPPPPQQPVGMPLITMYRPPEPELQTRQEPRRNGRRDLAWVTLQIDDKIAAAVPREVAAALRRELQSAADGSMADKIGKVLSAERKQFRATIDALRVRIERLEAERAAATVLDLSDERRRRAGE
jgi:hypothetical protein